MDSECYSLKKKRENNDRICMNEPKATLNYSTLRAEAGALSQVPNKIPNPSKPLSCQYCAIYVHVVCIVNLPL